MKKRIIASLLTVILPVWSLGSGVAQAAYPDKPINLVIAFTAGGSSDVQARIMQKYTGGAIGFAEIARAKKDGTPSVAPTCPT